MWWHLILEKTWQGEEDPEVTETHFDNFSETFKDLSEFQLDSPFEEGNTPENQKNNKICYQFCILFGIKTSMFLKTYSHHTDHHRWAAFRCHLTDHHRLMWFYLSINLRP